MTDQFSGIVGTLFCFGIYFMPAIFAYRREHPKRTSIFVINLFLGWTFLFWVISLAWSVSVPYPEKKKQFIIDE